MIDETVLLGSREYILFLSLLFFSRAMDFSSTWIATPNLVLEANPLARKLGWKWGIPVNILLCLVFAAWPLPAVMISTTSVLVASHNFQVAWLMRALGEENYRAWFVERLGETPPELFLFCLFAQTLLIALVGIALTVFSGFALVPFGIGLGILAYALAVIVFSLIALWRNRRAGRPF
jgi:hypothetical protein